MASGGHPHATLTMPSQSYSGEDQSSSNSTSPLAVWTAQVPALSAGGVVVNGPSDLCWQMVESGQQAVQLRRRRNSQKLFHFGRTLLLKHLPRDVNEHEIRDMLSARGLKSSSVTLSPCGSGPNWARAAPVNAESQPDFWEEWKQLCIRDKLDACTIRGHKISLSPSPTENLLCVARLPRDLLDDEFKELVSSYGPVRRCFLLYSDKTGESKGYGFVEYQSKDCGQRARAQLDGRIYEGQALACDWLDTSIVTLAGLHSKLLYVDCLPGGFRDMSQFRTLFSQVANPPYCQIALKGGAPQDWGLVEFSQAQEAEDTLRVLDGKLFHNSPIRVAFFIPGVRAINIYMKLLNDTCQNKGRAALLPEPPSDTVFHQLQNLTKQNPAFVHSLQNIILTQIQHLNNPANSTSSGNSSNTSGAALTGAQRAQSGHHQQSGQHHHHQQQQASNASLAASAQAALSMLLAAQQTTQPSPAGSCSSSGSSGSLSHVSPPPQQQQQQQQGPNSCSQPPPAAAGNSRMIQSQYGNSYRPATSTTQAQQQQQQQQQQQHQQQQQTFPCGLMEAPPLNINVPPPPFLYHRPPEPTRPLPPPPPPPPPMQMQEPAAVNNLQQTLSALLGTLSTAVQSLSPNSSAPPLTQQQTAAGALLGLLLQMVQQPNNSPPQQQQQQPSPLAPLSLTTLNHDTNASYGNLGGLLTTAPPGGPYANYLPPPSLNHSPSSSSCQSSLSSTSSLGASTNVGTWNHILGQVRSLGSGGPSSLGSAGSRGSSPTSSSSPSTSPARGTAICVGNNNNFATPIQQQGTKRKYSNHVLPSPEPSPEAGYIGQHSQGLGGHYADSYFKRKKRN
ncbi:ribonucleoprotein PTB-binding 1-like [Daphnia pulicaria]|uniref:ribonucleoprotein PTB-binding 1-like n=1 Tax=Daphnia pulicaria TaxID=35523 RepID=UPI001EE9B3C7|nr:ribonucleoprotein PTB-binding 1-like [Daphnia pulicaria]